MKMQELIGEFRDEMPKLADAMNVSREMCRQAMSLFRDFDKCESQEAKTALIDATRSALAAFSRAYAYVDAGVERLVKLNAGYTRVLGPHKPKAEDPGQVKTEPEDDGND